MAKSEIPSVGKSVLVDKIHAQLEGKVTKKVIGEVFDSLFEAMGNELASGNTVAVQNFMSLTIYTRKGGMKNVFGEMKQIADNNALRVKVGKGLKAKIAETNGTIIRLNDAKEVADEAIA